MTSFYFWFGLLVCSFTQSNAQSNVLANYDELKNYLFDEGGVVEYKLVSSEHNITISSVISLIERFINGTQSSEYGTEYFAFFTRSLEYLDYDSSTYQVSANNNTLVEIFLNCRIFKNVPTTDASIYPIEMSRYVTVNSDSTNQYEPNQRISNIVQIFNFSTKIPSNNDTDYVLFLKKDFNKNNGKQKEIISSYQDFYDILFNKYCLWTRIAYYGPPNDPHITASSYAMSFGASVSYGPPNNYGLSSVHSV